MGIFMRIIQYIIISSIIAQAIKSRVAFLDEVIDIEYYEDSVDMMYMGNLRGAFVCENITM